VSADLPPPALDGGGGQEPTFQIMIDYDKLADAIVPRLAMEVGHQVKGCRKRTDIRDTFLPSYPNIQLLTTGLLSYHSTLRPTTQLPSKLTPSTPLLLYRLPFYKPQL